VLALARGYAGRRPCPRRPSAAGFHPDATLGAPPDQPRCPALRPAPVLGQGPAGPDAAGLVAGPHASERSLLAQSPAGVRRNLARRAAAGAGPGSGRLAGEVARGAAALAGGQPGRGGAGRGTAVSRAPATGAGSPPRRLPRRDPGGRTVRRRAPAVQRAVRLTGGPGRPGIWPGLSVQQPPEPGGHAPRGGQSSAFPAAELPTAAGLTAMR